MRYPNKPNPAEIGTNKLSQNTKIIMKNHSCIDISETSSKSLLANVLDLNDDYLSSTKYSSRLGGAATRRSTFSRDNSGNNFESNYDELDPNPIKRNLNQILKELKALTQKIKDDEDDEEKTLKWKFAAMVMDRVCMIFFASATFLSTVCILLTSKNFFKFI
jgi:nicotinic acetylcholine receptor